jgi:carboxymethylenebutenolidase
MRAVYRRSNAARYVGAPEEACMDSSERAGSTTARAGGDIEIGSGVERLRGYLAKPAGGRGPGVVVIQEWWGLVDHIRSICDRLALQGFVALAPDLYRGETASDPDAAGRLMMGLEIPRAARDLDAAIARVLAEPGVTSAKVGAIGFCMGGQLALFAATRNRSVGAVVDCYGIHPNVTLDLAGLEAAVLGIFAERDAFVPPAVARKLETDLRAAGKRAHVTIYPGVDHAFLNDGRPDVFDAETAARAWAEAVGFLRAELA